MARADGLAQAPCQLDTDDIGIEKILDHQVRPTLEQGQQRRQHHGGRVAAKGRMVVVEIQRVAHVTQLQGMILRAARGGKHRPYWRQPRVLHHAQLHGQQAGEVIDQALTGALTFVRPWLAVEERSGQLAAERSVQKGTFKVRP